MKNLQLRKIQDTDPLLISEAFKAEGWAKPQSLYVQYLAFQKDGVRDIIIAEVDGIFAGYLTIQWQSHYPVFFKKGIPEIVDFNVLKKFQRFKIGTALMDEAEDRIRQVATHVGIGFGVTEDYGAAQILYIKRNYIPDGKGLVLDNQPVKLGDSVIINHGLAFHLIKQLKTNHEES